MKRKIKCYRAYTTPVYRILGMVLIPCMFWLLCVIGLWVKYGGPVEAKYLENGGMFALYFMLSVYIVLYEIFTDYWMLGGCLSNTGKELRYFRTSSSGMEAVRNIASVDLMRRFLYCMIFSAIIFVFTGWKAAVVMGLAMYCLIVAALNGSRHFDGLQSHTGIAFLAQVGMTLVNILNVVLIDMAEGRETVMLVCLAVLYSAAALCISNVMVRRITVRIREERN